MKSPILIAAVIAAVLFLGPAHLPADAQSGPHFQDRPTTLQGAVVQLMTLDPHALLLLDVRDETGETVRWQAILAGQQTLRQCFGWNKKTLRAGDSVTLTGFAAKSGSPVISLTKAGSAITNETGRVIFQNSKAKHATATNSTACATEISSRRMSQTH
jgi:hypothetical protein